MSSPFIPENETKILTGGRSQGKTYNMHLELLQFCETIAKSSNCLSRKVGAILVKDGLIVSTGFNRVPLHTEDCKNCIRKSKKSGESLDICKAIHAEESCILSYLNNHTLLDLKDCILYVSVEPCYNCAKFVIDCGIKTVYAKEKYNSNYTKAIFDEAKVKLTIL